MFKVEMKVLALKYRNLLSAFTKNDIIYFDIP